MTTLVLTNNSSVRVEYITDLLPDNDGMFTVFETKELSDAEKSQGLDFRQLSYDLASFKAVASTNNLKLLRIDEVNGEVTVADYTQDSSSSI